MGWTDNVLMLYFSKKKQSPMHFCMGLYVKVQDEPWFVSEEGVTCDAVRS